MSIGNLSRVERTPAANSVGENRSHHNGRAIDPVAKSVKVHHLQMSMLT
ncbi:MAG: hypothetical protein IH991_22395 [Planctomycetes bacterium]|nr:hypothetical protein [Planctomycetota bacterium]